MALTPSAFNRLATAAQKPYLTSRGAFQSPSQTGADAFRAAAPPPPADELMNWLMSAQPDYSGIEPVDFDKLAASAQTKTDAYFAPVLAQRDSDRAYLGDQRKLSQDATTNFNKALAGILTGGLEGQAGRDYAFKTFGGSYVGEIQTVEGQRMFNEVTRGFQQAEWALLDKYDKILDTRPDIYEKLMDDLVAGEQKRVEQGIEWADTAFDHRFKAALAIWQENKRQTANQDKATTAKPNVRNFSDGTTRQLNPETGKWDVITSEATSAAKPRVFQTAAGIFAIDEATGQVVWEKKTGKAKTAKTTTQVVEQPDGSKVLINKATGKQIAVVAPADSQSGSSASPSTVSNTVKRATDAGEAALTKVTDAVWKKMPGSNAGQGTPEYAKAEAAYNAWLDSGKSFGTAMARVITSISPHLKAIGYTRSQIRRAAYQIVSAEIDPPKGYKPPKASAARVAASNTMPALDFGSLSQSAVGKVGQDLGGPEAHHARPLGNWQSDNAWDIGIPIGTPIYAVTDGVVGSDVGSMSSRPGDGQRLTLSAADNAYWYGHLSRISVKPGQRVRAGQLLGYSGASSNGAAHLHLGVRDLGGNYS